PCVLAGAPAHGASAIELVSAIRSQPSDVCNEHFLGKARGLSEGDAARLPLGGRGQLYRTSGGQTIGIGQPHRCPAEAESGLPTSVWRGLQPVKRLACRPEIRV